MGDGTETPLPKRFAPKGTGDVKALCPFCSGRIFVSAAPEHSLVCDYVHKVLVGPLIDRIDRLEKALAITGGRPRKRRAPAKKPKASPEPARLRVNVEEFMKP